MAHLEILYGNAGDATVPGRCILMNERRHEGHLQGLVARLPDHEG
jgi:hypothetical protein